MFQVGRYDPGHDEQEKKSKLKKVQEHKNAKKKKLPGKQEKSARRHSTSKLVNDVDADGKTTKSSLYVIAPESKVESKYNARFVGMPNEAFDDLEIIDDLLENTNNENQPVPATQNEEADLPNEFRTALHMSSLPIKEAAEIWGLAPFLVENLLKDGYEKFFLIQSLVIPDVIASERHSNIRVRDVCVAAPTGSGKTLAFVVPILNSLASRQVKRLRALVVLPSRDLALQVFEVFDRYTKGSDLKVGIAIGQSDFAAEQRALTIGEDGQASYFDPSLVHQRALLDPNNVQRTLEAFSAAKEHQDSFTFPCSGMSAVDLLVCTPGRLVDHLDNTPGFTLQHLRFLVIDEADRLLSQSYHNWIGRVISSSNSASVAAWQEMTSMETKIKSNEAQVTKGFEIDPITWRRGGVEGDDSLFNNNDGYSSIIASVCQPVQLRKLLYSATLTRDPQKLTALGLVNPKHYDAHGLSSSGAVGKAARYSIPTSLSEYTIECTAEQKPLILFGLLLERASGIPRNGLVVVFTSSLDSTHRLARLLQLLWTTAGVGSSDSVAEYSSSLKQHQRTELVAKCNDLSSTISLVVCSDSMSRGMDIESVRTVINYDVPSFAKTYVHRCGRTARAGRAGTAISLVKGGQANNFGRVRALVENPERVLPMAVDKEVIRPIIQAYKSCIQALRRVLAAEADGALHPTDLIPADLFPTVS